DEILDKLPLPFRRSEKGARRRRQPFEFLCHLVARQRASPVLGDHLTRAGWLRRRARFGRALLPTASRRGKRCEQKKNDQRTDDRHTAECHTPASTGSQFCAIVRQRADTASPRMLTATHGSRGTLLAG